MHLDRLHGRLIVRGQLTTQTALHIGGGDSDSLDPTAVDNSVVRDARGNPYIPGSSLKGAVRSYLESVMATGWLAGAVTQNCIHFVGAAGWESRVKQLRQRVGQGTAGSGTPASQQFADLLLDDLCPVCRLLGAPHYAARLLVRDLPVAVGSGTGWWVQRDETAAWVTPVQERTGVGIDRETRTARRGVLYDFETVPPGVNFAMHWLVENPTADDRRNICTALVALSRGDISLGGKTSRGLGYITLHNVQLLDLMQPQIMQDYVMGKNLDHHWQPLQVALADAELAPSPHAEKKDLLEAIAKAGDRLAWAEVIALLTPLFGGGQSV